MAELDVKSDVVETSKFHDPVAIREEDFELLRGIQARVDALSKYRQELGRLLQAMNNVRVLADDVEKELADQRRGLAKKYNLEASGPAQWAVDFEKKAFVRLSDGAPVIP